MQVSAHPFLVALDSLHILPACVSPYSAPRGSQGSSRNFKDFLDSVLIRISGRIKWNQKENVEEEYGGGGRVFRVIQYSLSNSSLRNCLKHLGS